MKRFLLLIIGLLTFCASQAQTEDSTNVGSHKLNIGSNGIEQIESKDGNLSLTILGMQYNFSGTTKSSSDNNQKSTNKVTIASIKGDGRNHIAFVELGSNFLVGTDYSMYPTEEQDLMTFTNHKSVYVGLNLIQVSIPLNPQRSFCLSTSLGLSFENYCFANDVTLVRENGMMRPLLLEGNIQKSKLRATYLHVPVMIDWNIKKGFFVAAGLNIDILLSSALKYKKPVHKETGIATLSPVEVGVTARAGWRQFYIFANYSLLDMFKGSTGPDGHRMSVGAGLFF